MKILVIHEKEDAIHELLVSKGLEPAWAANYRAGVLSSEFAEFDYMIIDTTLPDKLRQKLIRKLLISSPQAEILLLYSAEQELDRELKLYVSVVNTLRKPFLLSELEEKMDLLVSKKSFFYDSDVTVGHLRINMRCYEVYAHDELVRLSKKEYELLFLLVLNSGRTVSKKYIFDHLWGGSDSVNDEQIYEIIKTLKKKIAQKESLVFIRNVPGEGYTLDPVRKQNTGGAGQDSALS